MDLGYEGPETPEEAIEVEGNPVMLREMLSNLIDNALRYSPDGGAITVSIERDPRSGRITLAVSDTGPGIPPDERERVFEPFYRGADVVGPGTGLGLPNGRTIAQAHGAAVSLAPASDGRGLRVAVRFPGAMPLAA
jgi:two-component system sensor histidine kinase TctE